MSQWQASRSAESGRSHHPAHYGSHPMAPREPQRAPARDEHRPRKARAAAPAAPGAGYTLAHAGRQVRFGPVVFWIVVGTVVVMGGWSITAATYLAFRDDVLRTLIAHQADQQFAYEDRIAELRAQIDRATSRQLLDQEQFEQKLDELVRRQAALEQRAAALNNIGEPGTTGALGPASAKQIDVPRRDRQSSNVGGTLNRMQASLDRIETKETTALNTMQNRFENRAHRIREVVAQLGLKLNVPPPATGGPFVPLKMSAENQPFERALVHVASARSDANQLSTALLAIPVRKPVMGDIDETSPFGVRMDPFMHEAAMHTGIDFRGEIGEPIHATAAGTVTIAGWSGGYGKMVEVSHGNGLATRYGHLSEIDVSVGDKIRIGQVIGRLGSTGRSTGPHLHYETRVDGEAVNPQKFLDAGDKLFGG